MYAIRSYYVGGGELVLEDHRQGIGLLAGGAPRAPNPDFGVSPLLFDFENLGNHEIDERVEMGLVPEKPRKVGRDRVVITSYSIHYTKLYELAGGGDRAYPLVPLVEFPHTASLIHDDIEDGADERRGGAAIHIVWGEDTAINGASWLYFQAFSIIDAFPSSDALKLSLYRTVSRELRRLHLGQAMDIHWHRNPSLIPSRSEYEAMVSMKTGTLSRLAGEIGMLAGGASDEAAVEFGNIAARIGVGFQIVDDVRNLTTGNPGKRRGDDVVEGKKSLPVLLHLERSPGDLSALTALFEAARAGGVSDPSVERCIGLLESSGAIEAARAHGIDLIERSSAHFVSRYPGSPVAPLIQGLFAEMLKGL